LEARFEEQRLEKERAAILSEMSMVNTMDYRVECQILSALHAENKLALRFPIGKEELIRSWKLEDVKVRRAMQRCHLSFLEAFTSCLCGRA
jgi:predicted Zn-dependent peptidase